MRTLDCVSSHKVLVGSVDVARWDQYDLDGVMPFQAMWYSVPAGQSSSPDCHPEAELSVVLTGTAWVETADGIAAVHAGSAFLIDGDEPHTVHNRSGQSLLVFSAYWLPAALAPTTQARSA
jgi:mannose-6-phosphate isomerase-like protein (cupin superfamily)